MSSHPQTVVFACLHNAGRSQMAAAFFNQIADPGKARALSAGTQPAAHLHRHVIAAMREVGVDLSAARPRLLAPDLAEPVNWLITMGCGEACPLVPGAQCEDWPLADPKDQPLERVRAFRDEIRERVRAFVAAQRF
jgi:arsenate reductase